MHSPRLFVFVFLFLSLVSAFSQSQNKQSQKRLQDTRLTKPITQEQADEILQELKAIRAELAARPAIAKFTPFENPPIKTVALSDAAGRSMGSADAPLVLIEFADYQCPYCKRFHKESFEALKSKFIDTGKVRFVSLDLPLPGHGYASAAAQATRCAMEQGKFWEMRDSLELSNDLSDPSLKDQATKIGLQRSQFDTCLDSKKYQKPIDDEFKAANSLSITSTPSFILGRNAGNGSVQGELLIGALPFSVMEGAIDEQLKKSQGGTTVVTATSLATPN